MKTVLMRYQDEIKALVITLGDLRCSLRRIEKTGSRDLASALDVLIEQTMERKRELICKREEYQESERLVARSNVFTEEG